MKGIVIYRGKYGATRQYADWIAQALHVPSVPSHDIEGELLDGYDFIVLGTSVYIGKLQIENWITVNFPYLTGKKIFLFQVAGAPPTETEKRMEYNRKGIPANLFPDCEFYFLAGRLAINKLSWWDRLKLKMGARMAKDPRDRKNMLTDYDHVKIENLQPLLAAVKSFCSARPIPAA